jgi:hypothetical protein
MRLWFSGPRIFGLRTGVSFGPEDLRRVLRATKAPASAIGGAFVYVIKGDHGRVKVGVSVDPKARLADLQTASPFKLSLEWVGAVASSGFAIEDEAHKILDARRCEGEWFECPVEAAAAAVTAAAYRRHEQILTVDPNSVARLFAQTPQASSRWRDAGVFLVKFIVAIPLACLVFGAIYLLACLLKG